MKSKSLLALVLLLSSMAVQAGAIFSTSCDGEYMGWYIIDDSGIEVMGDPEVLISNEYIKRFILDVKEAGADFGYLDVCSTKNDEKTYINATD